MTNDYFPRPRPRGETRVECVERTLRENGFDPEGRTHKPPMSQEERKKIEDYLARHDAFFGLGSRVSVGDKEGDLDVE